MSESSKTVLRGARWTILDRFGVRLLGLVNTAILARILTPEDFGLVTIGALFVGLFNELTNINLTSALISIRDVDRKDYDSAFSLQILRGIILGGLIAAAAWPVSLFYDEPRLVEIMLCLAFSQAAAGLINIGVIDFLKHYRYEREALYHLLAKIFSVTASVTVALQTGSYFALVAGMMTLTLSELVLSYLLSPFRPRLAWSKAGRIFSFSKWMIGTELINFLAMRSDLFLIGRFAGVKEAGLYSASNEISSLPATELSLPFARAAFPVYASLREARDELRALFEDNLALLTLLMLPAACGIVMVAEHMVLIVLGDQWRGAIPLVQLLALYSIPRITFANAHVLFLALERPDIPLKLGVFDVIVKIPALIAALIWFGLIGAAWAIVASGFVAALAALFYARMQGAAGFKTLGGKTIRSALASGMMVGVLWGVADIVSIEALGLAGSTLTMLACGGASYALSLLGLWAMAGFCDGAERRAFDMLPWRLTRWLPFIANRK